MNFPTIVPQRIAVKVRPLVEKIIRSGHPWIFDQAITKQNKEGRAGDIAIVFDTKKNKLLAVGLYDPYSPIRIKVLATHPMQVHRRWWEQKIETALALRRPLLETDTSAYRLVHGENDGMPSLIVDVYAHVAVLKIYALIWLPYLEDLCAVLLEKTDATTLVLRMSRSVQKHTSELQGLYDGQVLYGSLPCEEIVFREHSLEFYANVVHGHKTGFFLDHRANRRRIGQLSKGKTVLDVFSYAGGFSVHALAGGAVSVTSMDISKQALEMARKNVALNKLENRHQCFASDAFEGMQQLARQKRRFDIVVVDPPSFAKRDSEQPQAIRAYVRLAKLAVPLVQPNGLLLMASCSSRISRMLFFETVTDVLEKSGRPFTILEKTFHDTDHPVGFSEGAYLKAMYVRL